MQQFTRTYSSLAHNVLKFIIPKRNCNDIVVEFTDLASQHCVGSSHINGQEDVRNIRRSANSVAFKSSLNSKKNILDQTEVNSFYVLSSEYL